MTDIMLFALDRGSASEIPESATPLAAPYVGQRAGCCLGILLLG